MLNLMDVSTCIFHPSSPPCPIAVAFVMNIKDAIAGVKGVRGQTITVKEKVEAETLTKWIDQEVREK